MQLRDSEFKQSMFYAMYSEIIKKALDLNIKIHIVAQTESDTELCQALIKEYKNINAHFTEQIDLSGYTKGIYLLKVKQAYTIYFGKVVVR